MKKKLNDRIDTGKIGNGWWSVVNSQRSIVSGHWSLVMKPLQVSNGIRAHGSSLQGVSKGAAGLTRQHRLIAVRKAFKTIVILFVLLLAVSCNQKQSAHEHDTYICPMHPTVVSDRPSTCPVCGMDLVRKARPGEEVEITEDLSRLLRSPNETVIASIKTVKGVYQALPVTIEANGVVTYDTRKLYTISARAEGRLEKVYLKYPYQKVSKGQKVAELYSPELLTAQRELLFLLENDRGNDALVEAAKRKLQLLGATDTQIQALVNGRETSHALAIHSPYEGYLITGIPTPSTAVSSPSAATSAPGMSSEMGSPSPSATQPMSSEAPPAASLLREGNYVTAGQPLFSIVNTNALRIELDIPGTLATGVKPGTSLELSYGNGANEPATVDFVQPFYNQGQNFVKIRVYTQRTGSLHIGHLVHATVTLPPVESLWVPREAVLDLGTRKIVFVKERGVFKPRHVTTGLSSGGMIQVISGLASSDELAANAHYMVDSESFIKL